MNTKSDMYILCKVERCLFGSEPDEFLDVPHVIGLFDDLQTAKYSINIVVFDTDKLVIHLIDVRDVKECDEMA